MEDFRNNLPDLQNVNTNQGNMIQTANTRFSVAQRNSLSNQQGFAVAEKNINFPAAPLYQQVDFPIQSGNHTVLQPANSVRYRDGYNQIPFSFTTIAVDMTNRNIVDNEDFKNLNSLGETTAIAHQELASSDSLEQDKNMHTKHTRKHLSESTHTNEKMEDQLDLSDSAHLQYVDTKEGIIANENCNEAAECSNENEELYFCGGCQQRFDTLCKLHSHIRTHNQSGSYYYSAFTRTAFPKFDICCCQTEEQETGQSIAKQTESVSHDENIEVSNGNELKNNKTKQKLANFLLSKAVTRKGLRVSNEKKNSETDMDSEVEKVDKHVIKIEVDTDYDYTLLDEEKSESDDKEDIANQDSDTDEYNPEESVSISKKKRQTIPRKRRKYGERNKSNIKGSRKQKQLKVERKEKTNSKNKKKPHGKVAKNNVNEKITCKQCNTEFLKKLHLRSHIKANHSDIVNLCQICSESFATSEELNEHINTEHSDGYYQCELCDKVISTKGMLEGHYLIHKGIKPFSCSICVPKKYFTRKCGLKAHMDTHSEEKRLQCEFCGKPFNARHLMLGHVKHCGGIKPYKCDLCEMRFVSNHCLQRHRRKHTGEKPFICEVCAFASSSVSSLARHMRVHTGEKPFVCQFCKQTFASRGAMKKHVRVHTQEKPYQCRYCLKAFTQNWNLKTHERQHTGETPYKCHVCGVGYKQNVLLKTHLRTHFAPNTDNHEPPELIITNSSKVQCQSEVQSSVQSDSFNTLQTCIKPEQQQLPNQTQPDLSSQCLIYF